MNNLRIFVMIVGLVCTRQLCAQHADFEIEVDNGGLVVEPRIGEGEFGEGANPANVADEPGFEVDDGVFQSGDELHFRAVDILGSNLWYWDGQGAVNFAGSSTSLTIEHPVAPFSTTLQSSDSGGAAGFLISSADADGGIHQDLEFILGNVMPDSGVYLFGVELFAERPDGSPLFGASEPVYLVLGSEVDEPIIDAAVDWTAANLVPEPQLVGWLWAVLGWLAMRSRNRI